MRRPALGALLALALPFGATPALAKKPTKKPAAAAAPKAATPNARAVEELGGRFKFGASPQEIFGILEVAVREKRWEEAGKPKDPIAQDRVRDDVKRELERIKATQVDFRGQATPWNVSIIDEEFVHGNEEAMLVLQEEGQQRFLFFYSGRLYKQYIAFSAEKFEGKTFAQVLELLQGRYGTGAPVQAKNKQGKAYIRWFEWAPTGDNQLRLRAIDRTQFYSSYCIAIDDSRIAQIVDPKHDARKAAQQAGGDGLVDHVAEKSSQQTDENSNVVDRVTGRKTKGSSLGDAKNPKPEKASSEEETAGDIKVRVDKGKKKGKKK